jgi:hypothetical protein
MFLIVFAGLVCSGMTFSAHQENKKEAQQVIQERIDKAVKAYKPVKRRYTLDQVR